MVSLSFSAIYMLIEEPGIYKPQHKPLYLLSLFFYFWVIFQNGIKQFQHILTQRENSSFPTQTRHVCVHFIHP